MLNIGQTTADMLRQAGIETPEQLAKLGAIAAWRRLREVHGERANRNALYAIDGALLNTRWNALPFARRQILEAEVARVRPPRVQLPRRRWALDRAEDVR